VEKLILKRYERKKQLTARQRSARKKRLNKVCKQDRLDSLPYVGGRIEYDPNTVPTAYRVQKLKEQEGRCGCCGRKFTRNLRSTIDVDQLTGLTRDLICLSCKAWIVRVECASIPYHESYNKHIPQINAYLKRWAALDDSIDCNLEP
jgi:hypothetical protein